MEEAREGDYRVPLVSSLFCLCVTAGGVLLVVYVFVPSSSKPWYPAVAFLLIGSPWIFWVLTYIYSCIKACVRSHRQISRRSFHARSSVMSSHHTNGRNDNESVNEPNNNSTTCRPNSSNDDGGKHVHFGGVVVHDGENSQGNTGGAGPDTRDSSVNSSQEIEMPLNQSVSS